MIELPPCKFDIYALALPRVFGFGDRIPCAAWKTADGKACAVATRRDGDGELGRMR